MTDQEKSPIWFWIVGVVALLWNGMGVYAYLDQALMSAEEFAALPEVQQDLLTTQPVWVTAAFAIAVFAGLVASIAFLLRKQIAVRLFLVSLVAAIVQISSYFVLDGYMEFISAYGWTMPALILLFAVGFWLIARHAANKGFLR